MNKEVMPITVTLGRILCAYMPTEHTLRYLEPVTEEKIKMYLSQLKKKWEEPCLDGSEK